MVEEDIVDRKARKGIKQSAEPRCLRSSCETADVKIGCERGTGKLKYKQRPHKVRHHPIREGYGEPEKGAAEQIKAV